jgi:hypothetical protein
MVRMTRLNPTTCIAGLAKPTRRRNDPHPLSRWSPSLHAARQHGLPGACDARHSPVLVVALAFAFFGALCSPARADDEEARPAHPLCASDARLDVQGFIFGYSGLRDALIAFASEHKSPPIGAISIDGGGERCAWNRYLFLDFALYFGLLDDVAPGTTRLDAASVRDGLFDDVVEHVVDGTDEGFAEWAHEDVTRDSLETFLARGSERFSTMERLIARVHVPPVGQNDDEASTAKLLAHRALSARTPFSSVFTHVALARATERPVQRALACLVERVALESCETGLDAIARACANDDDGKALELLGVFASQRMYLLRDLAAFVHQSARDDDGARREARVVLRALADGARAHHRIETRGLRCGARSLYPSGAVDDARTSAKPYHFYAVAHLAYTLRRMGVDEEGARAAALVDARRYKEGIRAPSMMTNVWLGRPVTDGTAGDTALVLDEQERGAHYGVARFQMARAAGTDDALVRTRKVRLPRALDRALVDVRFDPRRSSALLVTVRERASRPAFGLGLTTSHETVWRIDLGPGEKDALLARGLPLPGVAITDDGIRIRY